MIGRFPLNIVDTAYKAGFANPVGIAYDSGRGIIGVANFGSSEISFVDCVTFTVIATVNVPAGKNDVWSYITFDNAGDRYFAASERIGGGSDNLIYIINATTFSLSLAITDPSSPVIYRGIEFDYTNDRMFISCYKSPPDSIPSEIKIYKYSDFSYITNFIANRACGIVFDAVSNKLYVAGIGSQNLRIYDGTSYALLTTLFLGKEIYSLTQDPIYEDYLIVAARAENQVLLYKKSTNKVINQMSGINNPNFMVFVGDLIFITSRTLSKIVQIERFYTVGSTPSPAIGEKKKSIIVSSISGDTNYPVTLKLHKGNGTDTPTDIYLNKSRADWGDVRFTKQDSTTKIPYAITRNTPSVITVTLNVTVVPGDNTFYVFYNKDVVSGMVTKYAITTDQHYDPGQTVCDRKYALNHLDNFNSRMMSYNPDMILEGGDKTGIYSTNATDVLNYMQAVSDKHTALSTAIGKPVYRWGWGNHDFEYTSFSDVQNKYASLPGLVSGTLYGYWEDDNFRYISLDANYNPTDQSHNSHLHLIFGYINDDQKTWLTNTLASSTKPVILLCHHLLGEVDTLRGTLTNHENYHVQNRVAIRTILEASGKIVCVINGHVHWMSNCIINGIPYISLPDLNTPVPAVFGWDTPNIELQGKWSIIEIDRRSLNIRVIQEVQINGNVSVVHDFNIPYKTIYDTDEVNNPEEVFYVSSHNNVVSDASNLNLNNYTYAVAKPASIYDGDPRLSDRTIKIYGKTNSPNFGVLKWGFSPQNSKFKVKFYALLTTIKTKIIKIYGLSNATPALLITFNSSGQITAFDSAIEKTLSTYAANIWYEFDIVIDVVSEKYSVYESGVLLASNYSFNNSNSSLENFDVVTETGNMFVDFIRIEKYHDTHPVVTSIGVAEDV